MVPKKVKHEFHVLLSSDYTKSVLTGWVVKGLYDLDKVLEIAEHLSLDSLSKWIKNNSYDDYLKAFDKEIEEKTNKDLKDLGIIE